MTSSFNHHTSFKYIHIACWICTAAIGYNGFFANHHLLTIPLVNALSNGHLVFIGASVTFISVCLGLLSKPTTGKFLYALSLVAYMLLCLGDIHRLAPYMIVFYGLFACFIFLQYDRHIFYAAIIFLISGLYIFSGFHKINSHFIADIAPKFYFHALPIPYNASIGYSMAITEVLLGILLLFKATRRVAASILICMHLIIMWKLSPWKYGFNYIILPWNIAMISCLGYVIKQSQVVRFKIGSGRRVFTMLALFFWAIPLTSQFLAIPENISMKLYSGKTITGYLTFTEKIPEFTAIDITPDSKHMLISLQRLSMEERGVAFNPEAVYYERVFSRFRESYPSTHKLYLNPSPDIIKTIP